LAAGERERAERLARCASCAVVATGKVERLGGGRVRMQTPPDPGTGRPGLVLDELEFVHAVCQQVPARGMHLVRYVGVYANRLRRLYREARARLAGEEVPAREAARATGGPEKRSASPRRLPRDPGSTDGAGVLVTRHATGASPSRTVPVTVAP
jgi:hypothetical protein